MEKFEDVLKKVTKEDIEKRYITDGKRREIVAKELGISMWMLVRIMKYYGIKKDNQSIVEERKRTCLNKYGVDNPSKAKCVQDKIRESNIQKYGAPTFTATEEGKEAVRKTKEERYGNPTYNNAEKMMETKESRYGVPWYNNREKNKNTCTERYGVDNPFKVDSIIDDINRKRAEGHGYSDIFINIMRDRNKSIEFIRDKNYTYSDLSKLFNAPYYIIQMWASRLNLREYLSVGDPMLGTSSFEEEVFQFIKELGVENIVKHARILNDGREIDIYLPSYSIGIECNGAYWHGSLFKKKSYHQEKSKECEGLGIQLIHIYDFEWEDTVVQNKIKAILSSIILKNNNRIYARNCSIRKITNSESSSFLNENHLYGERNAQVTYGLFYDNELLQVMSFSKSKYNKNLTTDDSWEIVRECTKIGNTVVGGESKILKRFISDFSPSMIFAYCDFNKFCGVGYEKVGMHFSGYTTPNLWYVIHGIPIPRNPKKYKEQLNSCEYLLYGAGSKKYIMDIPK